MFEGVDFKKLMLFQKIDIKATAEQLTLSNINTNILESEQEYKTIVAMLMKKVRKNVGEWQVLYRGS